MKSFLFLHPACNSATHRVTGKGEGMPWRDLAAFQRDYGNRNTCRMYMQHDGSGTNNRQRQHRA